MMTSGQRSRPGRKKDSGRLPTTPSTKFVVDAMLGSLARKLRALGFDATYYHAGDDLGLLAAARIESRIILTSDRSLASYASSKGHRVILHKGKTDGMRISEIAEAASQWNLALVKGESLCSKCGGALEKLTKTEVLGLVPHSVSNRHRLFYRCLSCRQVYWRGSHWKKLRSLARRLS
jgi:uncharacterized protein with PIN domain